MSNVVNGDEYRDRIAAYIHASFGACGLDVYTEVAFGKTIIGKDRHVDVFVLRTSDQRALGVECKRQNTSGTTDEKIPYALQDLAAMWIPGVLTYSGTGWSKGVLHTLEGSRLAVRCEPGDDLARTAATLELDHVIASAFGLWDRVIPEHRRFVPTPQLSLPGAPFSRVKSRSPSRKRKAGATKSDG
ncbi:MAG: hypothetical protein K0V04_16150 [Deltaproteobacteria bacterium]|nr:hypothetical protein [Deltaproteobacteria bacterium]